MRYTQKEMLDIRTQANALDLEAPMLFWSSPIEKLCEICNGCGAESAPEAVRDILTWLFRNYTAAHCIHDCDFEMSDGTPESMDEANEKFYRNCIRLWADHYGFFRWVNPAALWGRNKIRLAYNALRLGSESAWLAAYEKNLTATTGTRRDAASPTAFSTGTRRDAASPTAFSTGTRQEAASPTAFSTGTRRDAASPTAFSTAYEKREVKV